MEFKHQICLLERVDSSTMLILGSYSAMKLLMA